MLKAGLDVIEYRDLGLRIAIVVREDQRTPEGFFETLANDRGGPTLVTTDFDQAVTWLSKTTVNPETT